MSGAEIMSGAESRESVSQGFLCVRELVKYEVQRDKTFPMFQKS